MGGSQGARSINQAAIEAFAERDGRDFHVIHLAGRRDYARAARAPRRGAPPRALHAARLRARPRRRLAACDLVLARSGGSIFEVAAAGRPAILVPYPHATADHQSANAAWMGEAGAAIVIADAELTPRAAAARSVAELLGDGRALAAMAAASAALARPDAARADRRRGAWRRCGVDERLERAPAALHRHRRRRDERPGAGLRTSSAPRSAAATAPTPLIWSACARPGSSRASATTPPTCPRGPRSSSRPRSARTTRSWRRARERGQPIHRGELLAELCAEKRLIAVAGTHGKTTTTAMLAWALRALGADPAFFVGGEVPGLGAAATPPTPAGARGSGCRRGRRERRQLPRAGARDRRRHQRRDGPPLPLGLAGRAARRLRASSPRRREGRCCPAEGGRSDELAAGRDGGRRFDARSPARPSSRSPSPAATTCSTPAPRSPRSSWPASTSTPRRPALADFPGVRRRLELKGERGGARIYDDYAHHPTEVRAAL